MSIFTAFGAYRLGPDFPIGRADVQITNVHWLRLIPQTIVWLLTCTILVLVIILLVKYIKKK